MGKVNILQIVRKISELLAVIQMICEKIKVGIKISNTINILFIKPKFYLDLL